MIYEAVDSKQEMLSAIHYGCVSCRTGREEAVVESLEAQNPGLVASYVSQIKRKSVQGVKSTIRQIAFPGYVFFKTTSTDPLDLLYVEDAVRLLETTKGSWMLSGMDEWFAKWLFEQRGVIGVSEAILVDNKVRVVSGPLKHLERFIVKVDRRNRSSQVALPFHEREVRLWLLFELVA